MNPEKNNGTEGEVLVRVEGVSKKFCRSLKKSLWYGLCDIGTELNPFRRQVAEVAGRGLPVAGNDTGPASAELAATDSRPVPDEAGLRPDEFYAVRNVSFELRRGECLGLIGHNGAGKTTLLKMLNGLIKPDAGTITMRGRVGALIALGAGFNPILTGRENIYVNGSVLGLSKKEIEEKMDEIIDFAEIGKFIDTPVQNYSSGMSVRLGFSVAVCLIKPDILILDEVLSVGDAEFRGKCLVKVGGLLDSSAVIFVSHHEAQIQRICDRVLWLEHGCIRREGEPGELLVQYAESQRRPPVEASVSCVSRSLEITEIKCSQSVSYGDNLEVSFVLRATAPVDVSHIIVGIKNDMMDVIAQCWTVCSLNMVDKTRVEILLMATNLCLKNGVYWINLNITCANGKITLARAQNVASFQITDGGQAEIGYQPKMELLASSYSLGEGG